MKSKIIEGIRISNRQLLMCLTDVKQPLQGLHKTSSTACYCGNCPTIWPSITCEDLNIDITVIISGTGSWGQGGWKQTNEMYALSPPCAVDNNYVSSLWLCALKHSRESEQQVTFTRRQCDKAGWRIWSIPDIVINYIARAEPSWQPVTESDTCNYSLHVL